jgi:5-hydroxyisourate hydrolase-like protein (transthyretin family)
VGWGEKLLQKDMVSTFLTELEIIFDCYEKQQKYDICVLLTQYCSPDRNEDN